MLKARYGWMAFGAIGLTVWLIASRPPSTTPEPQPPRYTTEEIAALNAKAKAKAEAHAEMTRIIRAHGYNCPDVKRLEATGPVPLGKQYKVWCGPEGSAQTYPKLVYEAVVTPQKRMIVVPWKD